MENIDEQIEQEEKILEALPLMDIKQRRMWDFYVDPRSESYGNAMKSALRAGYAKTSAANITNTRYFKERLRRLNMLSRAEKVLKKTLIMNTQDDNGKEQADLLRIQTDIAKHVTKTLGKDVGYSERSEVTGKDGAPVVFMPAELMEKYSLSEEKKEL